MQIVLTEGNALKITIARHSTAVPSVSSVSSVWASRRAVARPVVHQMTR